MSDSETTNETNSTPAKKKVPTWVWIVGGVLVFGLILQSCGGGDGVPNEGSAEESTVAEITEEVIEPEEQPEAQESERATETLGQANARKEAQSYLDFMPFSKLGLIEQLVYEGYSLEESTYAVDAVGADWNEQAALKAQSYLDYSSFSRQGLIDQLLFEGFTQSEAEYGVAQVGY